VVKKALHIHEPYASYLSVACTSMLFPAQASSGKQ